MDEYTLLSLNALPFALPFLVCAIIFNAALYGHLNFKHIPIQNISMIAAALMVPVAIFFVPMVVRLAFDFAVPLVKIHAMFSVIVFACMVCVSVVRPRGIPSPAQILGLFIFCYGAYSFLA